MSAGENFVFMFLLSLTQKHHGKLIVRYGCIPLALGIRYHFFRCELGGLPVGELNSVLDHLPLASEAMPAVLLVGFLETIQSPVPPALVKMLKVFVICFLGLLVYRPVCFFLGQDETDGPVNQKAQKAYNE